MRNQLVFRGKISSKNKFYKAFDRLISSGGLLKEKDFVSINPQNVKTAFLEEHGSGEFYAVMPVTNKKYRISKSVASSYGKGDPLHIVIETIGENEEAIILGKNYDIDYESYIKRKKAEEEAKMDNSTFALGRVVKLSHDDLVFIPNKKSFAIRQIPILNDREEWSAFQDKICVMQLVDESAPLLGGRIVEVKGDAGNPIHEYDAIAESYGAIMSWEGEKLEKEIARIPTTVNVDDYDLITEHDAQHGQREKIVDLRHIPFTTVDPATCKDMDDAIYSTFNKDGDVVCYIAVANVTKYFELNSEIGKKYIEGGFTIYAPNKAYNILPTKLSTGICSLNPHEDRLAFVVKVTIDKTTGQAKENKIYDAIIQSRRKYSYEEAQEIVDRLENEVNKQELKDMILSGEGLNEEEQVLMNYYAGQKIKQGFDARKMIRFIANKEREVKFDADLQQIVDIVPVPHLYYHEVIEAFMISANEATAKYAMDNNLPNIYRIHEKPNPHKVDRANEFFEILDIDFEGDLTAEGTRNLIDIIKNTQNEEVINNFLIKMQSRAVYSEHLYSEKKEKSYDALGEQQISHYALQSPHYSHTTSPIRRVPDYITQYNILAHMHGTSIISANRISSIVDIANSRQIEVDQAEKDFEDINSVMYCEQHIGEKMRGRVSKLRTTSPEEGYDDEIVVIVKEDTRGISVEIPLSQVLGRKCTGYELSHQRCAVYDNRGNIVLTLCKPIEFIIASADRKTMRVIGCAENPIVIKNEKPHTGRQIITKNEMFSLGARHKREKNNRQNRRKDKKLRDVRHDDLEDERYK